MKCFHPQCNRSAPEHTLYRINAKGVAGIWACFQHLKDTDAEPLAYTVVHLINILEVGRKI